MVSESSYRSHLKTYSLVLIKDRELFEQNIPPKLQALAANDTRAWYENALEFSRPPWLPTHVEELLKDLGYEKATDQAAEDGSESGYPSWLQP